MGTGSGYPSMTPSRASISMTPRSVSSRMSMTPSMADTGCTTRYPVSAGSTQYVDVESQMSAEPQVVVMAPAKKSKKDSSCCIIWVVVTILVLFAGIWIALELTGNGFFGSDPEPEPPADTPLAETPYTGGDPILPRLSQ